MNMDKNYVFYQNHLDELIKNHHREFVIIHDEKFVSYHKSFKDAAETALKQFQAGTFLVQECVSIEDSTLVFHSLVGV